MKTRTLLFLLAVTAVFSSCQKDNDVPNKNEKLFGTWNFVGMKATIGTSTIIGSGSDQEKVISSYSFDAENTVGSVTIDALNFTTSGIGYSFDTDIHTEMYTGGVLFDTFDSPFQMTLPLSNAKTTYTAIGTDSIHLQSGFLSFDPASGGSGTPTATIPQGFRISWDNDILVLHSDVIHDLNQNAGGMNTQVKVNATQIIRLEKQ